MKTLSMHKIAQVKSSLSGLGRIQTRSQFGGYSVMADGVMFAIVSEGELYLRANAHLEVQFRARGMVNMVYAKRGMPVILRYFWVDECMWNNPEALRELILMAINEAHKEWVGKIGEDRRLKDLPNIDANIERLLWRVGISTIYELRLLGAKTAYLQLVRQQKSLGRGLLLALAGAIAGYHSAVLPEELHAELLRWHRGLPRRIVGARPRMVKAWARSQ